MISKGFKELARARRVAAAVALEDPALAPIFERLDREYRAERRARGDVDIAEAARAALMEDA